MKTIDYTPCAGAGDYSVWAGNDTKPKSESIAHCPSEAESLIEHPEMGWGCPEEVAEHLAGYEVSER